jgi:hypothetical protein
MEGWLPWKVSRFSPFSGHRMNSFEDYGHAFIIRVWLEHRELQGAPAEWRGMIQHVASGERLYIKDLNQIKVFVRSYVEKMEVKSSGLDDNGGWT